MATINIRHNPTLDTSQLNEFLKQEFHDKYEVYAASRRQTRRQILIHGYQTVVVVKKNWFCGAFVLLEQKTNETQIKVWSDPPSDSFYQLSMFLGLLVIPLLIIVPLMKILSLPITRDVRQSLKKFE